MARARAPKKKAISIRERLFAHEYVRQHGNGKAAAIAAGYAARSAEQQASRLVRRRKVAGIIESLNQKLLEKVDAGAQEVLDELRAVGMARLSRVLNPDGSPKPVAEWGEEERVALSKLEVEELYSELAGVMGLGREQGVLDDGAPPRQVKPGNVGRVLKVEMAGKLRALELLARHHKLLTDRVEHSVSMSLEELVAGAGEEDGDAAGTDG